MKENSCLWLKENLRCVEIDTVMATGHARGNWVDKELER